MSEREQRVTCNLLPESIKVIAEASGTSNVTDDAVQQIATDCTYRLNQTIQEAVKFMHHGKRLKLTTADFDNALRCKNVEPLYGFSSPHLLPFSYASGNGRDLYFTEDKDYDLGDVINSTLPKIPQDISIKPHWLCIDGTQPAIPDNPPPLSKDLQKDQMFDEEKSVNRNDQTTSKIDKKRHKVGGAELIKMKDIAMHELSVEQQLFYKEITEACVGSNEIKRSEALQSLATDPGLHQMVPRFSTFVSEGVKINVVQYNLAILIYLMRMVKSIMDNQTLYLDKYLHELIPAILTCIVSRQLCLRPDIDNHWALRDFATRLIGQMCRNFSSSVNNVQARVTKMFSAALQGDKTALATQYGAIGGLGELGHEVTKTFLVPHVRYLSNRIQQVSEGAMYSNSDKTAVEHIKKTLVKYVSNVLKTMRSPADTVEDYVREFGFIGPLLHTAVGRERQITSSTRTSNQISAISRLQGPATIHAPSQVGQSLSSVVQSAPGQGQKFVYITQGRTRAVTPSAAQIMKIISTTSSMVHPIAGVQANQAAFNQKIVVVPMTGAATSTSGTSTEVTKPSD